MNPVPRANIKIKIVTLQLVVKAVALANIRWLVLRVVKTVTLVRTDPAGPRLLLAQADVPLANIRWLVLRVVKTVTLVGTDPVGPRLLLAQADVPLANIRWLVLRVVKTVTLEHISHQQELVAVQVVTWVYTKTKKEKPRAQNVLLDI